MTTASVIIGISSVLFSLTGLYFTAINILYNLYTHARSKIELSCKYFSNDYQVMPTNEQVRKLDEAIAQFKITQLKGQTDAHQKLYPYFEVNLKGYKLIINSLNFLTLGKFQQFT